MSSAVRSGGIKAHSLKDQNRPAITGVLGVNLVVLVLLLTTGHLRAADAHSLLDQWQSLLPASVGVALAGVINGLLDSDTKARLVFWRWSNPLPGSRAFSHYAQRDPRIDVSALKQKLKAWPAAPQQQNSQWYKLYKSVENEPAVVDAHRHFLLTRDYTAISFLLLLTAGPLSMWLSSSGTVASAYAGLLALQYLLVRKAACNYGARFVTSVLALKAAQ